MHLMMSMGSRFQADTYCKELKIILKFMIMLVCPITYEPVKREGLSFLNG